MMITKQRWQSNVDNDGDNGDGRDGNGDGNGKGNGNDAAAATNSDDVDDNNGGKSRTAIGWWQLADNNGIVTICVNNDGDNVDGGQSKGDGDGDGNGNGDGNANDAAAVDSKDVDEDRTAIGRQQWDNVDVGQQ